MSEIEVLYKYIDSDGDALEITSDIHGSGKLGINFSTPDHGVSMFESDILEFITDMIGVYDKMQIKKKEASHGN